MPRRRLELDEMDLSILRELAVNARVSYTELARRLGVSDVAVAKRVRRLEELGVVRGYTVVVDHRRLGYNMVSLTGLDVEPEELFKVASKLRGMENIRFLALTSGDHSIMAVIWARNGEELSRIHEELSRLQGVRRVCPAVILEVVKDEGPLTPPQRPLSSP